MKQDLRLNRKNPIWVKNVIESAREYKADSPQRLNTYFEANGWNQEEISWIQSQI